MKKLMILLLIAFLSCSDSETFEPTEPEPTCFYVYGKSTGNGWYTECNSDFLLILIDERTWLSGNYTRRDALEICVTNEDYKFNDINLRQKICNIEDFTN